MTTVLFFLLALLYSLATFVASSIPGSDISVPLWERWDLIAHAVEYGLLSYLVVGWVRRRWAGMVTTKMLIGTVAYCALIGGMNEIYQLYVPGRTCAWDDETANIVGAALVTFAVVKLSRGKRN